MRKLFIFSVLLLVINGYGQDEEWVSLGKNVDGVAMFVKGEYVTRGYHFTRDDLIKTWVKFIDPKQVIKGKTYTNVSEVWLVGVDANTKEIGIISNTSYSSKGAVLKSRYLEDYEVKYTIPPPGTAGDIIVKAVLKLANN